MKSALPRQIAQEIEMHGTMPFARFMELALYAPELGYYERRREIGRGGDFFTSVSAGSLFGELLAVEFCRWLDEAGLDGQVQFVEAGAHDGRLAADILGWIQAHRPGVLARLEYWLLESSPVRRGWQDETLRAWEAHVKWVADIATVGKGRVTGILFSNEFLDALPVHRLAWNAARRRWDEWQVVVNGDGFAWKRGDCPAAAAAELPPVAAELAAVLPDGYTVEVCPAAAAWWRAAAESLGRGKLLTIDYGTAGAEWFRPERGAGTARAFFRHHGSDDLLANPGEQDLTADVRFETLRQAGEAAGLRTEGLFRQSRFLTEIFSRTRAEPESFGPWDSGATRQFQTLTHPEHLGEKFQVLVQGR